MSEIQEPGPDRDSVEATASYGGPGWVGRVGSHGDDVRGGTVWHDCGTPTEWAPLREVVLSAPSSRIRDIHDPDAWLMFEAPDFDRLVGQADEVAAFYRDCGIRVHMVRPPAPPPPNFLFMRDVFAVTPEGALLGRLAGEVRAEEGRFAAAGLAEIGVPLAWIPRGTATFEGADLLWIDPKVVLLGVGCRTNVHAREQLTETMASMGVDVIPVELPSGVQHLLGVVNFVSGDLAVVHGDKAPGALSTILNDRGFEQIEVRSSDEVDRGGGMNFVTIEPRRIVMPSGCPATRAAYEERGIRCHELDVSEYLKAAGGLACLTGILQRGGDPAEPEGR